MKYAIITPTFQPHFKYIDKYLESYNKFVSDKSEIEIIFTISKDENKAFQKILTKYKDVTYKVVYFEDLLKKFNIPDSPDELLNKYKKFTFQTLKKFYTMLDSDAEYFLVLDSESMWIKETKMVELFDNYYKEPFLTYSSLSNRNSISSFTMNVIKNTNYLLNKDCDKWFLENFVWFYSKNILKDLFNELGAPILLADKIYNLNDYDKRESGIFEIVLYQNYLYNNNQRYNYKLINADELLSQKLSTDDYKSYINNYHKTLQGNFGILEQSMLFLTTSNYKLIADVFKQNNFNIIRCDHTNLDNFALQKAFLGIAQPNILAASQDHAFGINNAQTMLLRQSKYYNKLCKHTKKFLEFLGYLIEPISIMIYLIKFLLYIQKFNKKYKKISSDFPEE